MQEETDTITETVAVVLAAGKSTRMRSKTPKVLHPLCGQPLLSHILNALGAAGVSRRIVVVGHQAEAVQTAMESEYGAGTLEYALQAEQKGTGHAVQMVEPLLSPFTGTILVLPGDAPLLTAEILSNLLNAHNARSAAATVLTAVLPNDAGAYGRILRDSHGDVAAIVEAKDALPEQLALREINTGVYAFSGKLLFRALRDLRPNNAQGELYLTDVIGLLKEAGETVAAVVSPDAEVILGVNTRVELAEIGAKLRFRLLKNLMLSGVTITDPHTTYIDATVEIGTDSTIHPFTHLLGKTRIGEECVIGPHSHITSSTIGDRVQARFCVMDSVVVEEDSRLGPYTHLRPGSHIGKRARLGNFVETKATILGDGVSVGHLTYLGDATVGEGTNIGGGTITCNYDGYQKSRTVIGARNFIGSHTALVAPVTLGDDAFTAAGSVITEDVPADTLAVARERQVNKEGWVSRRRERIAREKETKQP